MTTTEFIWQWQVAFLFAAMSIVTIVANRLKNAGLVDIVWAFGFTVLVLIAATFGEGYLARKIIFSGMVGLASLRLTVHLIERFIRDFPTEDGRYNGLRKYWNEIWPSWAVNVGFAGVFYFQGLLMWFLGLSFAWVCQNQNTQLQWQEWLGLIIWMIGFIGESIADQQLKTFLANPENKGLPCQSGLWHYSRHPNYFCQWLLWVSYAVFALGSKQGWLFLYAPLVMLYLLTQVSGVKATENQSLKTRGEAYREYQLTTPAFFPALPRLLKRKDN